MIAIARNHPEADGRSPVFGEQQWVVKIPLQGNVVLELLLGKKDRDLLFGMLIVDAAEHGEEEPA